MLELAEKNNNFKAIDRAIGKNGFKVVTLLRLSPLLPLALSNYFYGLTSVDLPAYVAGSWLGMLPGTILYVIAGELLLACMSFSLLYAACLRCKKKLLTCHCLSQGAA